MTAVVEPPGALDAALDAAPDLPPDLPADPDGAAMSVADAIAELDLAAQPAWIASLPDQLVYEVARREWWYVARPEGLHPDATIAFFAA